jgi:hypothetical protein
MLSTLRNIILLVVGLVLVGLLILLAWPLLMGRDSGATSVDFASLLPTGQKLDANSPAQILNTGDQAVKQWLVFYKREKDATNCTYGYVFRASADRPDEPRLLVPQPLTDSQADVCLGTQHCTSQIVEALKAYTGPELAVWGYTGSLPTRLNLFYWDSAGQRYTYYPPRFDGECGVRFDGETIIVKKIISVGTSQEPMVRNTLCQFEVYEQRNNTYTLTKSTVRFLDEKVPSVYPTQPEEVVVAFCLQYQDEGARKRYLDPEAQPNSVNCLGGTTTVEVLGFLTPPTLTGNWASVQVRVQVGGQPKDTTWWLQYAERPTGPDAKEEWHWRITNCL